MVETDILVGMIGAIGAVLAASIPYYLTKRNEIAINIQKTKLERYDDLLQKFVLWLQSKGADDEKSAIEFIMAYQRASSYASAKVLTAIWEYTSWRQIPIPEELEHSFAEQSTKRSEEHRKKIDKIFLAIREDIQPTGPPFDFHSFIHPKKPQH